MKPLVLLTVPGLRGRDVEAMPSLRRLARAELTPSFPAVTCCVQTNITTGRQPNRHGVVANGLLLREETPIRRDPDRPEWPRPERLPYLEMWTAPNQCVEQPQIWDALREKSVTSAVWFPLHSKFCRADYVCTPAPIHNPDGSESLWCYTKPAELYGTLREQFGDFPLHHFWGPRADLAGSRWIADSALWAMRAFKPGFFDIYLPHLDYAAQKTGPDSPEAAKAVAELDRLLTDFLPKAAEAYGTEPDWLVVGEYAITPVTHVAYPNRVLRDMGLLHLEQRDGREYVDPLKSRAFAVCDHQFAHLYVHDRDAALMARIADRFRREEGIAEVLVGPAELARYAIDHPRSGEIVLISAPDSWQAYYYWEESTKAPEYARTVDIHLKPGYDPVEMFWDQAAGGIALDATLIKGSHGAPPRSAAQKTVLLASDAATFDSQKDFADIDLFGIINR